MATYRIGHFADVHYPLTELSSDIDHLYNTLGSDIVVWGGDQVAGDEDAVPHTREDRYSNFWEDVESQVGSSGMDDMYAVPGNHDIPVVRHERLSEPYIGDNAKTPQELRPVDGLTILLIDTQQPSRVQGGVKGVGQAREGVPWRQLEWSRQRIQEAHSRGDAIIILGHAPVLFGDNSNILSYNPDGPWSSEADYEQDAYRNDGAAYEIVENFLDVYLNWSRNSPVVYHSGHDNHNADENGSAEFYENQNGIYHTWQDHYGTGANGPYTFAYTDVDTSTGNVTYTTVQSGSFSETEIMNVTPSW